jgi:hypothetical protein
MREILGWNLAGIHARDAQISRPLPEGTIDIAKVTGSEAA